jgi:hypothetical protein
MTQKKITNNPFLCDNCQGKKPFKKSPIEVKMFSLDLQDRLFGRAIR